MFSHWKQLTPFKVHRVNDMAWFSLFIPSPQPPLILSRNVVCYTKKSIFKQKKSCKCILHHYFTSLNNLQTRYWEEKGRIETDGWVSLPEDYILLFQVFVSRHGVFSDTQ